MSYTWTLRSDWNNTYTRSVKAFKKRKKKFKKNYQIKVWRSFDEDFPDPRERESVYKELFNMTSIDVFESWNVNSPRVSKERLRVCYEIFKAIS